MNAAELIIQALCFAFLHSIWQGLVFAILIVIVNRFGKNLHSNTRYSIFLCICVSLLGSFLYTFFSHLNLTGTVYQGADNSISTTLGNVQSTENIFQSISAFSRKNSVYLFGAWLIIFTIKTLLLTNSLIGLRRLKQAAKPLSSEWQKKFKECARNIGVTSKVTVAESYKIVQPIIFGYIKPLILLPVGLISQLSIKEVEAILYHELAHIKRRDYSVNLILSFFENVFFFNPFFKYISAHIKKEREFCCDAIAIEKLGDQKVYIRALISFAEMPARSPYALSFNNDEFPLTERVNKIIKTNRETYKIEQLFLFGLLISSMIFCLAFSSLKDNPLKSGHVVAQSDPMVALPQVPVAQATDKSKLPLLRKPAPDKKTKINRPVKTVMTDTIPKVASKEYIDGYNAGKNYSVHTQSGERFKIETSLAEASVNNSTGTTRIKSPDPVQEQIKKREIELRMRNAGKKPGK